MIICENANFNEQDFIRVATFQLQQEIDVEHQEAYMLINEASSIMHASWEQGNDEIFTLGYAGVQWDLLIFS